MAQYPEAAAQKCSVNKMFLKNHKIHKKATLLEPLFDKVSGPEACKFIKRDSNTVYFSCAFGTFFGYTFLQIILYQIRMTHLCQEEFPRLYTNLVNQYFPVTLIL